MTTEKFQRLCDIVSELRNDSELCEQTLKTLLMSDTITIAKLVQCKEEAMRQVLNKNKEDLSNASALLVRYGDKINTKTLKADADNFIKEQGFFNVK